MNPRNLAVDAHCHKQREASALTYTTTLSRTI